MINLDNVQKANLLSVPTLVEAPFVYVKIGDFTFGLPQKIRSAGLVAVDYPNFIKSLGIIKVNGEVNTYTFKMVYALKQGDDPNLISRILSSVSDKREIIFNYGDWCSPGTIFKEEHAIITNVTEDIDYAGAVLSYDIAAVSTSLNLMSTIKSWPSTANMPEYTKNSGKVRPSTRILDIIRDKSSGVSKYFTGMNDYNKVLAKNLIATTDLEVIIKELSLMSTLEYLKYLVSCMKPVGSNSVTSDSFYALTIVDDIKNDMGGSYFTVKEIRKNTIINADRSIGSYSSVSNDAMGNYQIDIGYPGNNYVQSFSLNNNDAWAILYKTNIESKAEQFLYYYDKYGTLIKSPSPSITRSTQNFKTNAIDELWWTKMTEFPISAKIKIKGLVRPTLLTSYVTINSVFFGRRHVSSGVYIILLEEDSISESGYTTELTLQRIKGDE